MNKEEELMQQCIKLAEKGAGHASPNPLVGCVIVKDGNVISTGYHEKYGEGHAEANALAKAGENARGGVAYVTLEPCIEFPGKKTPSCAKALIAAGVKKVVIGARDVSQNSGGKGIQLLRQAGIEVVEGVLEEECIEANKFFFKHSQTGLPYVKLKMAVSQDGKIYSPEERQISSQEANGFVHKLRNDYDAIMVGAGTVLTDNPRLTCRIDGGRNPLRVIIDSKLECPINSRVFDDTNCIIYAAEKADENKVLQLEKKGIKVIQVEANEGRLNLSEVFKKLGEMKVNSVLVEGGKKIASTLIREKLADEIILIQSPKILGIGLKVFDDDIFQDMQHAQEIILGDNVARIKKLKNNSS